MLLSWTAGLDAQNALGTHISLNWIISFSHLGLMIYGSWNVTSTALATVYSKGKCK